MASPDSCHSHKMVTSFTTRDCSMSPTIRRPNWYPLLPPWPFPHCTLIVSSTGPNGHLHHNYIHLCSVCSCRKSLHHKPLAPIDSSWSASDLGTQFQWIPLRATLVDGHYTILVVVCHLTKMALSSLPSRYWCWGPSSYLFVPGLHRTQHPDWHCL